MDKCLEFFGKGLNNEAISELPDEIAGETFGWVFSDPRSPLMDWMVDRPSQNLTKPFRNIVVQVPMLWNALRDETSPGYFGFSGFQLLNRSPLRQTWPDVDIIGLFFKPLSRFNKKLQCVGQPFFAAA